jgi:hypothetical protein
MQLEDKLSAVKAVLGQSKQSCEPFWAKRPAAQPPQVVDMVFNCDQPPGQSEHVEVPALFE